MEYIPDELLKVIAKRLKLGDREKPVCRVEVDRLTFVPGGVEEVQTFSPDPDVIKKILTGAVPDDGATVANEKDFAFPLQGGNINSINSNYGMRTLGGQSRKHHGVDMAAPVGTGVLAAWSGKVILVQSSNQSGGYGNQIHISHGDGLITKYAHLSKVLVSNGQMVSAGQKIGGVGNTGLCFAGGWVSDAERSSGAGSHLHFGVYTGGVVDNNHSTDPRPYLTGAKKVFGPASVTGVTSSDNYITMQNARVVFEENFLNKDWIQNPAFSAPPDLLSRSSIEYDGDYPGGRRTSKLLIKYDSGTTLLSLQLRLSVIGPATLDLGFDSDFPAGSLFRVWATVDGKETSIIRYQDFNGSYISREIKDVAVPEGEVALTFNMRCDSGWPRVFKLDYIRIKSGQYQGVNGEGYIYREYGDENRFQKLETAEIPAGRFIYMDTLELENVIGIEMDDQFEMDAASARVTISNPGGYYSPDFNAYKFPEAGVDSPWSCHVNGVDLGVLSENTPVRIYLGYGRNLVRVFTGLIDKVDICGADQTLTIYCRNMYKRILEKVITERKCYPDYECGMDVNTDAAYKPSENPANINDREQLVVYYAQQAAARWGVDYRLILAISAAETGNPASPVKVGGFAGKGLEAQGSYICGYGINASDKFTYAGIPAQCHYTAKRIKEALNGRPATLENIKYFQKGGDLGKQFTWCPESNWPDNVWNAYQLIGAEAKYNVQYFTGTAAAPPPDSGVSNYYDNNFYNDVAGRAGTAWLKSAIVHDLAAHARLTGWRASPDDRAYPDVVIEEAYLISANPLTGQVIKAGANEGEFTVVPASAVPTPEGWKNPLVESKQWEFDPFKFKVAEAIREIIRDTPYRSYCDRYGTYRLEAVKYNKPVAAMFTGYDDLMPVNKSIDFSRARSHICVVVTEYAPGNPGGLSGEVESSLHMVDNEILMELKGEIRSCSVAVSWARTQELAKVIAKRMFWDMKRLCRTLQVVIPGRPDLDVLDRVYILDKTTGTRDIYCIKGIKTNYSVDDGYLMTLELFWADITP
ncbi:peptidase, M23/M37 family [Desulfocucumis palustris]|uniref:Peptidase, M23/M37 family n=1 Tax=Desulfocucumis palustris TaxID=1898651 RepID=A0A2L2X7P9_9FIRM|nr:M23 family metallopeptidase [Desulfocucumis palustris]GBF32195.1 peptidase, M23/M37 family [Desulfocucumis palustris]